MERRGFLGALGLGALGAVARGLVPRAGDQPPPAPTPEPVRVGYHEYYEVPHYLHYTVTAPATAGYTLTVWRSDDGQQWSPTASG